VHWLYLADHSERLLFGPLVSPVSFRDPVMLARQALAIDDRDGLRAFANSVLPHV
jgi:alkanesulfonate monooxygenase SsuD/methylene tetrahydromethanopterin reductase-like flavin-dependent oxidoreductase (luciferase family)